MEPPCIAVIEDDAAILDMTAWLLELQGYRPVGFGTAAAGASALPALQPALVIVDLHLERPAAGLELVLALRADAATARLPILLWSADPDVATIVARRHVDGVVVRLKPVLPEDLLRLVASLLASA